MDSTPSTAALNGTTPALDFLGVIAAEGPDAARFLHGQLTQDFVLLDAREARLAALCTAKGRMIASFIGLKPTEQQVLLVCSRDILAATLKRLSMYVLRAQLKLRDASADYQLFGLAGAALPANGLTPQTPPYRCTAHEGAVAVSLYPADGVPRALWLAPAGASPPQGEALSTAHWTWSEVRSAVVTLSTPVLEAFVPQMLNYESVGGVNFKKGCYPGQEVVARSQFRGTLKRRAYLVSADQAMSAGDEVVAEGDTEQPVGTVVQAAPGPDGRWSAVVSMQISALQAKELHVNNAKLRIDPQPYALLEDV